jgi:simple sugar transport system ATP-binding protein
MTGITKAFPGVQALDEVDFRLRPNEIHALMGENGAGKSTLIKVLTGVYRPDRGTTRLDHRPIQPGSPLEAERFGISTVYQEINLVPQLSVAENLMLGRQPTRFGVLCRCALRERARSALARVSLQHLDLNRQLSSCSVAVQQLVAIARALDVDARVLILDEPTSSLDEHETEELFRVLRELRDQGLGILFVTHFLDQVYAVSDRITVLRNGRLVGEFETRDLPRVRLVGHMLGREIEEEAEPEARSATAPVAAGDGDGSAVVLRARGLGRRGGVESVDLTVAGGEVVGLAGLLGAGRTETAQLVFGLDRAHWGELEIGDERSAPRSPRDAVRLGVGYCAEDRKTDGLIPSLSVRENILLALQARRGGLRRIRTREQVRIADGYVRALNIRTPGLDTPISSLSGGNQQKALLARWLALDPVLLILDEPTRGIDVGAKAEIEALMAELRDRGMAILFISSELEELVRNCSRVVVLRDCRSVGELAGRDVTPDRVMRAIARTTPAVEGQA